MDAIENLKNRRTVRAYKNKEISRDILEEVVDCGRLAATAMNNQPWAFVVITSEEGLNSLKEKMIHSHFACDAKAVICVFCESNEYYLEDGSAASENILLAAHAKGLGSCWVAGDKQDHAEPIRELLKVPDTMTLVSIISLGYPEDELPDRDPKKELKEVLFWEKYQ